MKLALLCFQLLLDEESDWKSISEQSTRTRRVSIWVLKFVRSLSRLSYSWSSEGLFLEQFPHFSPYEEDRLPLCPVFMYFVA